MNFYFGGYFLVKLDTSVHRETKFPQNIWTVSNCINKIYPQEWAIDWVNNSDGLITEIKQELKINSKELKQIQEWVTDKFNKKEFGWPNVFMNLKTAREFYNKFLSRIAGIKLIGIYLGENDLNSFLDKNTVSEGIGQAGIYENLATKKYENKQGSFLGYEVLGFDVANFHSFVCNYLGHDYTRMFGISFNENGLINDYEISQKALEYTISDECGAEPADWRVWKLKEFLLN
jgi:hypothetical protein